MEHGLLFALCRLTAQAGVALGCYPKGPWGADWFAIALYARFCPAEAHDLAWQYFPEES
jgi:hypothetical protein